MKLLLDTHTFIWWDNEPDKLPKQIHDSCQDPTNELLLSLASVWELQIKIQLGKLKLRTVLEKVITDQQTQNGLGFLPITPAHIFELQNLPHHHRDPFDRLLIAQARLEDATPLSKDEIFASYPVTVLWG
jgi:PIN domain nuclease of toxin-antitoxin system